MCMYTLKIELIYGKIHHELERGEKYERPAKFCARTRSRRNRR